MPNCQYIRVRAAKDAPSDRFRVLERRHDLAEIVERGAGVSAERLGVFPAYPERESMSFSESASRHRNHFAHQRLGFIEAIEIHQILHRHGEVKSFLKNEIPRARRVLGESHDTTFTMRWVYAEALCKDEGATVNDLREGVETLEDTARMARRALGGAHPITGWIEDELRNSRAALGAREETPSTSA